MCFYRQAHTLNQHVKGLTVNTFFLFVFSNTTYKIYIYRNRGGRERERNGEGEKEREKWGRESVMGVGGGGTSVRRGSV